MRYLLLILPLFVASCAGVPELYVKADRGTFEAIAPEYEAYVSDDPDLDDTQRELRLLLLESWELRLAEAEKGTE